MDWNEVASRYQIGTNATGRVKYVWQVGAVIQLEPGLTGLVLHNEITWDGTVPDVRQVLREGDPVRVQVLQLEPLHKRLLLSIRHAAYDPWILHGAEYSKGRLVRGRVVQVGRDGAELDLEDHVSGFLPHEEVVRWPAKTEEIIEVGDWVEAKVLDRYDSLREIRVSMKQRLDEIERDAEAASASPALSGTDRGEAHALEVSLGEDSGSPVSSRFSRALVAEDQDDQRLQMCLILYALGIQEVAEAGTKKEAVERASAAQYDVVFMNPDMPAGDGEAGVAAAAAIKQAKPDTAIILVTGNRPPWTTRGEVPPLFAGMITKPFSLDKVSVALRRLNDTGEAEWPEFGSETRDLVAPHGVRFIEEISRIGHAARPLKDVLTEILQKLAASTGATAGAVFRWNRLNKEILLEASLEIREADFQFCRPNLNKSPVTDLFYQPDQPIFYGNIERDAEGKFRHLRPILGYKSGRYALQSCIGELIGGDFDLVYTLFLFGERTDQFSEYHHVLVRAATSVAGSAIREHWIVQQVASERRLTTLGGMATSAAHELKGRLSALEAVNRIRGWWRQLKAHPSQLADPAFVEQMDRAVDSVSPAKKAMDDVVARILGWARTGENCAVDLKLCIQSAVTACSEDAMKNRVTIRTQYAFVPPIFGNPVELEQAFVNVILNAIQHMKGTHRRRGLLDITLSVAASPTRPVQIRFRDTGPGIHSRFLDTTIWGEERIFHPLFTTKMAGTGMGLYITRGLIGNHGGKVSIEKTAMMAGTTVLVELPQQGGHQDA